MLLRARTHLVSKPKGDCQRREVPAAPAAKRPGARLWPSTFSSTAPSRLAVKYTPTTTDYQINSWKTKWRKERIVASSAGGFYLPLRGYCTATRAQTRYEEVYRRSLQQPEEFWAEAAKEIDWHGLPSSLPFLPTTASSQPFSNTSTQWFEGGEVNACWNALDRHALDSPTRRALIYHSAMTETKREFTFAQLRDEVAKFAGVLTSLGVNSGDTVVIYMPMVPQAVIGMLACARIGAIHSVVFGGFAADQLAIRINHAKPKVILTASCGLEPKKVIPYKPLVDKAIDLSQHKPSKVVVYQRGGYDKASLDPTRDVDWEEVSSWADPVPCVPVSSTSPLYVLYTSGTTGDPKGLVRDIGGYLVALKWSMKNIYDVDPGDVFWAASDIGWVVGHSYIVYGPLIHGCTSVLFEGKPVTPDAGIFWRVISDHQVKAFFTSPTAFRTLKREDPAGKHVKKYAGERADPDTIVWAEQMLPGPVPVVDHWWQTETGWPVSANCLGLGAYPIKYGSVTHPVPGYDVKCLDDEGRPVASGKLGNLVLKLPLPPGCVTQMWYQEHAKFKKAYLDRFPGYYNTGDAGIIDPEGYLHIMSRTDDIINVSGVRLSTGAIEEVIASHHDVAECCVVGPRDNLKGQVPVGFVVIKSHVTRPGEEITTEVVRLVRDKIGPIASFKAAIVVDMLPKTRSGKILRATLKKMTDGDEFVTPATIENPAALAIAREAWDKWLASGGKEI